MKINLERIVRTLKELKEKETENNRATYWYNLTINKLYEVKLYQLK